MTTITEVGRGLIEVQALKVSYILWEEIYYLKVDLLMLKIYCKFYRKRTHTCTHVHTQRANRGDKIHPNKDRKEEQKMDLKIKQKARCRFNPKLIDSYIKSKWSKYSN